MKTLLYLSLCCLSVQIFGQNADLQVKSRKQYLVFEEKGDTIARLQSQITYDMRGNIIEEIQYPDQYIFSYDTVFLYKNQYIYDSLNHLVFELLYTDGNVLPANTRKHRYTYNDNGSVGSDSIWSSDSSGIIIFYTYDRRGNVTSKNIRPFNINYTVYPINEFDEIIRYSYSIFNNCLLIDYTGMGIDKKEHFRYDLRGNCIEYEYEGRYPCGNGIWRYECKYGNDSKLIEKVEYHLSGSKIISSNYYTSGLLTKKEIENDKKQFKKTYTYQYAFYQ